MKRAQHRQALPASFAPNVRSAPASLSDQISPSAQRVPQVRDSARPPAHPNSALQNQLGRKTTAPRGLPHALPQAQQERPARLPASLTATGQPLPAPTGRNPPLAAPLAASPLVGHLTASPPQAGQPRTGRLPQNPAAIARPSSALPRPAATHLLAKKNSPKSVPAACASTR